jgi:hypothetical protein
MGLPIPDPHHGCVQLRPARPIWGAIRHRSTAVGYKKVSTTETGGGQPVKSRIRNVVGRHSQASSAIARRLSHSSGLYQVRGDVDRINAHLTQIAFLNK